MKPELQQIAIAEALGWKPNGAGYWHKGNQSRALKEMPFDEDEGRGGNIEGLPDYLNDLNLMHSAVLSQSYQFRSEFSNYMKHQAAGNRLLLCELTAKDWAKVFLKTIGKWEPTSDSVTKDDDSIPNQSPHP